MKWSRSHLFAFLLALGFTGAPAAAANIQGSLSASSTTLATCSSPGDTIATVQLTGTWTGTITPAVSLDQNTWTNLTPATYAGATTTITGNGLYQVGIGGGVCVRLTIATPTGSAAVRLTTVPGAAAAALGVTSSGNVTIVNPLDGSGNVKTSVQAALPAGTNALGSVTIGAALPAGTNALGSVTLGAGSALAGKFGIDQTTPGTTNGVAVTSGGNTLAPNSNGSINASIYNGAGVAIATSVVGSSVAGGTGGVMGIQGITGGIAVPVSGTFWQATQPVSGTVTANQGGAPWSITEASTNNPCNNPQNYNISVISGSSATTIATHSGSTKIYICGLTLQNEIATGTLSVVFGTGSNCGTGTATIDLRQGITSSLSTGYAGYPIYLPIPVGNDVCILPSGTGPVMAGSTIYVTQ